MLPRFRQMARRWPGPCLALVLLAFTSQSMATTLDWCLHGGDGAHVAGGLLPCDGHRPARVDASEVDANQADGAKAGAANPPSAAPASLPCHGADAGGVAHPMHHVAASSDGASSPVSAVLALPVVAHWHFLPRVLGLECFGEPDVSHSGQGLRPEPGRPALSGAIPGESSRLLI